MAPSNGGKDLETDRRALQQRISQLTPKARLDALIGLKDAARAIQRTPAEDLYLAITDVGLADTTDIVQLVTPRQFQTFIDLGAWKKDELDVTSVITWLRAARGEDDEVFLAKVRGMDIEVLEILLRETCEIYDLEENPDANPQGVTFESPEGRYLIEFKVEGAELAAVRLLLNNLYAENAFETTRLLEAIRWELATELSETAFRFRSARLEELGFPDPESAASVYAFVKPETVHGHSGPAKSTALVVATGDANYLESALNGLNPEERDNAELELRHLVNAVLVADGADPGDVDAIRGLGERARDYLCLALEYLSGQDLSAAVEVLRQHPSKRIFQVGFSLTVKLKHKADALMAGPLARVGETELVFAGELAALHALRKKRPMKAVKVEGAEPMPFRFLRELRDSEALLDRVAQQLTMFEVLLSAKPQALPARFQDLSIDGSPVSAERLFVAVLAHALLDHEPWIEPVAREKIDPLLTELFEGPTEAPKVRASARTAILEVLENRIPEGARVEMRRLVDATLERLRMELGPAARLGGTWTDSLAEAPPRDHSGPFRALGL